MPKKSTTYKGKAKPYGKSGHFHESRRHSLQARGVKTGNVAKDFYLIENRKTSNVVPTGLVAWHTKAKDLKTAKSYLKSGFVDNPVDLRKETPPDKVHIVGNYLDLKDPEYRKNLKDTDGDGVPDIFDCDPNDPTKQDEDVVIGGLYPEAPIKRNELVILMPDDVKLRPDDRTHATDYHRGNLDYHAETEGNKMYIEFLNADAWLKDAEQKNFEVDDYLAVMKDVLHYDYGLSDDEVGRIIENSTIDRSDFAKNPDKFKWSD